MDQRIELDEIQYRATVVLRHLRDRFNQIGNERGVNLGELTVATGFEPTQVGEALQCLLGEKFARRAYEQWYPTKLGWFHGPDGPNTLALSNTGGGLLLRARAALYALTKEADLVRVTPEELGSRARIALSRSDIVNMMLAIDCGFGSEDGSDYLYMPEEVAKREAEEDAALQNFLESQTRKMLVTKKDARPKYQVFISSPFRDLEEERKAVIFEVLAARHIPAGMESFPAGDDRGWRTIARTIDVSDYYVVILGGLYGSIDPETGLSWTEREYDYARANGLKVLAFLRELKHVRGDMVEPESDRKAKLDAFRDKLKGAHLVKTWTTTDDLRAKVVQALNGQIQDDVDDGPPRPGWYRGDQVPEVRDVQQKLDEQQGRVRKLEEELYHFRNARRLKPGQSSQRLGTDEVRYEVDAPIKGWHAYHTGNRRITVNGVLVSPGGPLPHPENGKYIFVFGSGAPAWMAWQYWDESTEELERLRAEVKELEAKAQQPAANTTSALEQAAAQSAASAGSTQPEEDDDIDSNNASRVVTVPKLEAYFEKLLNRAAPGQLVRLRHEDIAKATSCSEDDVLAWLPDLYLDLQKSGWKDLKPGNTKLEIRTPGQIGFETASTFEPNTVSGALGAGERRFVVDAPISSWEVEYCDGRTIEVNGVEVAPGRKLPAADGGKYYFKFSAGPLVHAQWSYRR